MGCISRGSSSVCLLAPVRRHSRSVDVELRQITHKQAVTVY